MSLEKAINNNSIRAVDLFCGAGGLTRGMINAGIDVVAGFDVDFQCKFPFEFNNRAKFIEKDVSVLEPGEIRTHLGHEQYTVLAGCAPCQPFSTYSRSTQKKKPERDKRWDLLTSFEHLVSSLVPDFVTMENVPGLEDQKVFKDFVKRLKKLHYFVDYKLIYCPDYGLAQTRKRLVLVAGLNHKVVIPPPSHKKSQYKTVKDVISHLPSIKAGEFLTSDPLHRSSKLSEQNLRRIQASAPGGTWLDWPEELRAECHKKSSGETYLGVYGRMKWDEPSSTITTQFNGYGNGRFGHPEQDRAISLREAALLQSFPENYQFFSDPSNIGLGHIARMIGNAVPVLLGELVGKVIVDAVNSDI
ncbi:DNA (cytosine-5-)-methyltransferase [Idiomarina tyrosinivorans]|uniref:DNA (cytosine-5-)-methyltransferase n=1 Tax=Idiomarina tyrosinivorans TaxID=1445662 RepID=A0A432ZM23_9GAMM|nr:DNA cytosine methyltransferase [Idiomarina tyrosinivorans]RUO78931.1 DNA (cytosine-5-)-methyltransferase [Idiomarina tyrosinivorans]